MNLAVNLRILILWVLYLGSVKLVYLIFDSSLLLLQFYLLTYIQSDNNKHSTSKNIPINESPAYTCLQFR